MSEFKNRCAYKLCRAGCLPYPDWDAEENEYQAFSFAVVEWLDVDWCGLCRQNRIMILWTALGLLAKKMAAQEFDLHKEIDSSWISTAFSSAIPFEVALDHPEWAAADLIAPVKKAIAHTINYPFDTDIKTSRFQRLAEMQLVLAAIAEVVAPWD